MVHGLFLYGEVFITRGDLTFPLTGIVFYLTFSSDGCLTDLRYQLVERFFVAGGEGPEGIRALRKPLRDWLRVRFAKVRSSSSSAASVQRRSIPFGIAKAKSSAYADRFYEAVKEVVASSGGTSDW